MDGPLSLTITYQNRRSDVCVRDYSDLQRQTQSCMRSLPPSFVFSLKDSLIDCQDKFRLHVTSGAELSVREIRTVTNRAKKAKTKIITGAPGMRLANRAFLHQKLAKEVEVDSTEPADDARCPICIEGLKKPMKAKCGHVCCLACWEKALERVLECPMCRGRVRLKLLRPL